MLTLSTVLAFLAPMAFKPAEKPTDVAPKPAPCSIDGLIAWLETKNPAEAYNWNDIGDCLVAQYFRAAGINKYDFSYASIFHDCQTYHQVGCGMDYDGSTGAWTFGRALERARAWKASHEA